MCTVKKIVKCLTCIQCISVSCDQLMSNVSSFMLGEYAVMMEAIPFNLYHVRMIVGVFTFQWFGKRFCQLPVSVYAACGIFVSKLSSALFCELLSYCLIVLGILCLLFGSHVHIHPDWLLP